MVQQRAAAKARRADEPDAASPLPRAAPPPPKQRQTGWLHNWGDVLKFVGVLAACLAVALLMAEVVQPLLVKRQLKGNRTRVVSQLAHRPAKTDKQLAHDHLRQELRAEIVAERQAAQKELAREPAQRHARVPNYNEAKNL
jgi:hypothetical protein